MSAGRFEQHGEVYVTLRAAAECYHVEVRWVEEVYASGLLGPGERVGGALAIAETELDRLAAVVRWQRHFGLDLEAVVLLMGG